MTQISRNVILRNFHEISRLSFYKAGKSYSQRYDHDHVLMQSAAPERVKILECYGRSKVMLRTNSLSSLLRVTYDPEKAEVAALKLIRVATNTIK